MTHAVEHSTSPLAAVSNAMIALHKEQFGRGPSNARSYLAGPDTLVSVLEDALLPAERKLVLMGEHQRVRETRLAYQVAASDDFIAAVEDILDRKVRAFASSTEVVEHIVFETFVLERRSSDDNPPV